MGDNVSALVYDYRNSLRLQTLAPLSRAQIHYNIAACLLDFTDADPGDVVQHFLASFDLYARYAPGGAVPQENQFHLNGTLAKFNSFTRDNPAWSRAAQKLHDHLAAVGYL
jgi:hypothetical protein